MDEPLIHYGVKGMKWGVRKPDDERDEVFRRRAKQAATVAAVGVGIAAAVYLGKSGKLKMPVKEAVRLAPDPSSLPKPAQPPSKDKSEARRQAEQLVWQQSVAAFQKMIADAHADDTKYMKKFMNENGGPTYVPATSNEFTPEARARS